MTGFASSVKRRKFISKSQRANVLFPVGRLHRYLKEGTHKYRIGIGAAVYAASVIEYLTAEVLELAGNTARDSKKSRITPRHILFAVATDIELHDLLQNVTIASGGVIPHIHPHLLAKKKAISSTPPSPAAKKATPRQQTPNKKRNMKVTPAINNTSNNLSKTGASGAPLKMRAKGLTMKKASSPASSTVLSEKKLFLGQMLTVLQCDITTVTVDAIVHPTNGSFALYGEIGSAMEKVGGKKLVQEVADVYKKMGNLAPCDVAVSPTVNMPSRWIIHVNGPSHGDVNAYDKLETSVKNCLILADLKNFKSIALPSIGSGKAGFPKQQAAQTIIKSICDYFVNVMSSSLKQVYFVLYDMESIGAYTSELAKLDG
ncbi:UNVERIFIED_CONTAM: hypothetical protein GTU68_065643 [Idotea baltica]|nr:hypothetical protein [Idotea baltica]